MSLILLTSCYYLECEIGFEYVTGTKWVRIYFFCFHLGGVIIISNVVTSFIINAYFQQLKTIVQRLGREENVDGEAMLTGNRGVFDASTVTGTRTGVDSIYIARINPRHNDIEVDERSALRHLFTRTNISNVEK